MKLKLQMKTGYISILILLLLLTACDRKASFQEKIMPPGNEYYEQAAPAADDADYILTDYQQLPDSLRQKIDCLFPGGVVENLNHWGPFRYTLIKKYPDGHSNQLYVYLDGRIYQAYYIDGDIFERPGIFYVAGTERQVSADSLPEPVQLRIKQLIDPKNIVDAWTAPAQDGTTFVVEATNYQGADTTAFAFRPDGAIKTMSNARQMHKGLARFWSKTETYNYLQKYRNEYSLDQVLARIKGKKYDPSKGFRFVVFSDPQNHTDVMEAVCRSITEKKPAFAICTGDLVEDIWPNEYEKYLFGILGKYAGFDLVPVIGNHDVGSNRLAYAHRAIFGDNSLNYYFDYGTARFVILDNVSRVIPFENQLAAADRWLSETPPGNYKFVFAHVPPAEVKKWSYHSMSGEKSLDFTRLMEKHHVDGVFMGHIHAYSTATYNGINYTINGGAGGNLHKQYGPNGSVHHYLIVDVTPQGVEQQLAQILMKEK